MPFDVRTMFCEKLDFAAAGTIYSDVLDTGAPNQGDVEPIMLDVWSNKVAAGAGTLDISLESSVDEAFTAPVQSGIALAGLDAAALAAGEILLISLPNGVKQYLRLKLVTTTGFTAGSALLTAGLKPRY